MKKFTKLMTVVCSLALAGAVVAQQPTPEESQAPGNKKQAPKKEQPATTKPAQTHAPKTEAPNMKEQAAPKSEAPNMKEHTAPKSEAPAMKEQAAPKSEAPAMTPPPTKAERKSSKNQKNAPATTAPATTAPSTNADQSATTPATTPDVTETKKQSRSNKKNAKTDAANANALPSATVASTPKTNAKSSPAATAATTPAATAAASMTPAPTTAATMTPNPATTAAATGATMTPATTASVSQTNSTTAVNPNVKKQLEPQKVQEIRQQHASFRAQPRPQQVQSVTFNAGFRLPGAERWSGPQYEVYRSYHPERHDRGWYSSHYPRVELIAGGYYYFNAGYWYPAWGYDNAHEYYAYDAPIYVGKRAVPPDQVIADVQAALKDMGYYRGEVDGLIGPLTREALTAYQSENGMTVTAVIDEPTLDALNMSS